MSGTGNEKNQARIRAEAKAARVQAKRDELEKQKALDLQQEQTQKTTRWHELIAAAADEAMINPKNDPTLGKEIFKLCVRGVPPSMRGTVWPLLIGNSLKFYPDEFSTLRKRADALRVSAGLGTAFGSRVPSIPGSQAASQHGSKAHEKDILLDVSMDSELAGLGGSLSLSQQEDSRLMRSWEDDEAQLGSAGEETSRSALPATVRETTGLSSPPPSSLSPDHSGSHSGTNVAATLLAAAMLAKGAVTCTGTGTGTATEEEKTEAEAEAEADAQTISESEKQADAIVGTEDAEDVEGKGEGKGIDTDIDIALDLDVDVDMGDILFLPYSEPPSEPSSPKQTQLKSYNRDASVSAISDDIGIDLSRAFAYDMPTPPRRHSGVQLDSHEMGPPGTRSNLDGLMERLSELNRESSLGIGRGSGSGGGSGINSGQAPSPLPVPDSHKTAALIKWDLPRTFPTLIFFHDGGSIQADLERILCAYTLYRPDIGYVQGMSFVAAMLLLYMDDAGAFQCLANLLSRKGTRDFFSLKQRKVAQYVHCFDHFFEQSLPLLFTHMRQQGLTSEMFLLDWHLTLFAKALPLDVAARVWDCYLAGGELFSLRCALGILRLYAPQLCQINMEELMAFLTHLPHDLKAEQLLDSIAQIKISHSKYHRFQQAYNKERGVESDVESVAGEEGSSAAQEDKSKSRDCVIA